MVNEFAPMNLAADLGLEQQKGNMNSLRTDMGLTG